MADIENGGFAFPGPVCGDGSEHQITDMQWQAHGLTLRDYFAAKALAAKMAPGLIGYEDQAPDHRAELIRRLARDCWEVADAMLKARKEPQ